MAEVVQDAQQEFWRPPAPLEVSPSPTIPDPPPTMAEACAQCSTEFMIGSRFCHTCGSTRPERSMVAKPLTTSATSNYLAIGQDWLHTAWRSGKRAWQGATWLRYLHFHEIKRWVGLPTASFIAFLIGVGCITGAIGVSLLYRASNLGEFQAVQMWRIEWLLAATAAFVAGILLKPSGNSRD